MSVVPSSLVSVKSRVYGVSMHKRCRGFELEAEPLSFYHIIRKGQPSTHSVNFTTDVLRDLQFDEAEQCTRSVILKDYNNFRT